MKSSMSKYKKFETPLERRANRAVKLRLRELRESNALNTESDEDEYFEDDDLDYRSKSPSTTGVNPLQQRK